MLLICTTFMKSIKVTPPDNAPLLLKMFPKTNQDFENISLAIWPFTGNKQPVLYIETVPC